MKFKSALVTQISGSIGGMTGSHNKGGMYFRARTIPVNPNTPQQARVKAHMAAAASRWSGPGSPVDHEGWEGYAFFTPFLDSLGDSRILSGLAMFCRSAIAAQEMGLAFPDDAPLYNLLTDTGALEFDADSVATDVDVTFDNTQEWATETGGALSIYASPGQNPTVNFYKGPYRYAGVILGDTTTPPTSPATIALPFGVNSGQRVFFQARAYTADGRLSYPFRLGDIAT